MNELNSIEECEEEIVEPIVDEAIMKMPKVKDGVYVYIRDMPNKQGVIEPMAMIVELFNGEVCNAVGIGAKYLYEYLTENKSKFIKVENTRDVSIV